MSVNAQMVKLSAFSPLCWATVSRIIPTLVHPRVLGWTVQCQLMYQPGCVTDVVVATSVKRFSSIDHALLGVVCRRMETSSELHSHASRVWFRRHVCIYNALSCANIAIGSWDQSLKLLQLFQKLYSSSGNSNRVRRTGHSTAQR